MFALLRRIITYHWFSTLLLMTLFALVFGVMTVNIYELAKANLSLIARYGSTALADGALQQFLGLVLCGFVASIAYTLIKACERVLVRRILED